MAIFVNYNIIDTNDILNIHKYLVKRKQVEKDMHIFFLLIYNIIDTNNILNTSRYLMKITRSKNNIIFGFIKKMLLDPN